MKNKKITNTSCAMALKVTVTDIVIKTSSLMLVVFAHDGGDTVGPVQSQSCHLTLKGGSR